MARGAMRTLPAATVGYDYSFSEPNHAQAWDLGFRYAMSYLADPSVTSSRGKMLTKGRIDRMADAGMGILPNWEQSAGDPKRGAALGARHGRLAREGAEGLDIPSFVPIVFSCDVNVSRSDWPALDDYFLAAAANAGRIAPNVMPGYVESDYIDHMVEELGFTGPMWWPAASSWSNGRITPNAFVKQLVGYVLGGSSDANVTLRPTEFWFPNETFHPQETDMPTLLQCTDAYACFISPSSGTVHSDVSWVRNGAEVQAFQAAGVPTQAVTVEQLRHSLLHGPTPVGDVIDWSAPGRFREVCGEKGDKGDRGDPGPRPTGVSFQY